MWAQTKITGTISATYFSSAFQSCISAGCDSQDLINHLGLKHDPRQNPYKRISADAYMKMLHHAEKTLGETGVGVKIGQEFRPQTFRDIGYVMIACDTMEKALHLNTKYQRLTQEIVTTTLTKTGQEACVELHSKIEDPEYLRPMIDVAFSGYFVLGHWLAWMDVGDIKTRVQFRHKETPYADVYRQVFKAELEFEAPRNAITFHASVVELELPQKNPDLVQIITDRLDKSLAQLDQTENITEAVYDAIEAHLPQEVPTIGKIAKSMGMSERTLRRRLNEENPDIRFRDVLQKVRRNTCEIYLKERSISMAQLSEKLGFKEQSSFSHAFKNWYGMTPRDYMDQQ